MASKVLPVSKDALPERWTKKSVSQIADIQLGGTPKTYVSEYWNGPIQWVTAKDVSHTSSRYVLKTERTITEKGVEHSTIKILPKDTTIITARGVGVGDIALLPEPMAFNQTCYGLNSKGVDPIFLFYKLKSSLQQIKALSYGTVFTTITIRTFNDLHVSYPEAIVEQQAIAKILSDLDSRLELNEQMNHTLEAIGQILFKRWFVDFEFPDQEGKPYKSTGGKMVASELGEIPQGWYVKQLRDFGTIVCGKTPPKSITKYFGGRIPFIKIPDMHSQLFVIKTEDTLTQEGESFQLNKTIPAGALCVSCIATVGLVSITTTVSQTNQQINCIIPNKAFYRYYLFFTMKSIKKSLEDLGSGGSTTLNVNTSTFSGIQLIQPNETILEKYHSIVEPLLLKIKTNLFENQTLAELRDQLLPKLMSGKIRVQINKNDLEMP